MSSIEEFAESDFKVLKLWDELTELEQANILSACETILEKFEVIISRSPKRLNKELTGE